MVELEAYWILIIEKYIHLDKKLNNISETTEQ